MGPRFFGQGIGARAVASINAVAGRECGACVAASLESYSIMYFASSRAVRGSGRPGIVIRGPLFRVLFSIDAPPRPLKSKTRTAEKLACFPRMNLPDANFTLHRSANL